MSEGIETFAAIDSVTIIDPTEPAVPNARWCSSSDTTAYSGTDAANVTMRVRVYQFGRMQSELTLSVSSVSIAPIRWSTDSERTR